MDVYQILNVGATCWVAQTARHSPSFQFWIITNIFRATQQVAPTKIEYRSFCYYPKTKLPIIVC